MEMRNMEMTKMEITKMEITEKDRTKDLIVSIRKLAEFLDAHQQWDEVKIHRGENGLYSYIDIYSREKNRTDRFTMRNVARN